MKKARDILLKESQMGKISRWARLRRAIGQWWRNEEPSSLFIEDARKFLIEYDELYCKRVQINPKLGRQAAEIVFREGRKRIPKLENEVRVLALVLERIVGYLELASNAREPQGCVDFEAWGGEIHDDSKESRKCTCSYDESEEMTSHAPCCDLKDSAK